MQYLQTHQVTPMLNAAVNELAKAAPVEPYSFLINSLLKAAAAKGVETAFELRMKSIQATLEQEQAAAQGEVAALKKRISELEGGAPAGGGGGGGSGGNTAVPLGHTPFSWNGGLAEGADVSAETSFSMLKTPPVNKKAAAAAPAKKAAAPAAPAAAAAAKKQPEKAAAKAKPAAKEAPKEAPKDEATLAAEAAAKAAAAREKFLAKIIKEGGKKGVEIEVAQHVKSAPWAAPQLGSCAASGHAWRLWLAQYSQGEASPLGAHPLPRLLYGSSSEPPASIAADSTGF
jgi:hypothetical protein